MTAEVVQIGPQPGPQTEFLSTKADIAVYGGAAGSGKTYGILLEPLRHLYNKNFSTLILRRNSTMIRNQGGLWDESLKLYPVIGGYPREYQLSWKFPSGADLKFAHLEKETTVYDYQGAQIPLIIFDELTHFSQKQFFYMLSRNRSMSGVPGYIRATCNPDRDSWVRKFIDWYIDGEGYPIPERSGVLRWFIRVEDRIIWADSPEALKERYGQDQLPKSFTFIPAKITDNRILMEKDPSYMANLNALSRVDRKRLKDGNWNVREAAGELFKREWFRIIDAIPSGWIDVVRFWDRAATKPSESNPDPDWTRGALMFKYADGRFVLADMKSMQDTPHMVEELIKNVASHDGHHVKIVSQQDPGSAGVMEANRFVSMLNSYIVYTRVISKDKITRAKPVSAQAEAGNIMVLRGPWNEEFFAEIENFPESGHDDQVDVFSGAYNELTSSTSLLDAL